MITSRYLAGLTAILFLVLLTVVAGAETIELKFWYRPNDTYFEDILVKFNEEYADHGIEAIGEPQTTGGESFEKYALAIAAGSGPDVMWFERSQTAAWAEGGFLLPVCKYMEDELDSSQFVPAAWSEVVYEGRVWAIPWSTDIRGLCWNVNMLEEAGLDSDKGPSRFADLGLFARKLTVRDSDGKVKTAGFVPWEGNWFFPAWSWTFGGSLFDPKTRKATVDSPTNVEALEWVVSYTNLYGPGELPPGWLNNAARAMVLTEDTTMIRVLDPMESIEYSTGPVPHPEGGHNGTWGGGFAIGIVPTTRHPRAATLLAGFLARPDVQLYSARNRGGFPCNLEAASEYKEYMGPQQVRLYDQIDEANPRYPFIWVPVFYATWDAMTRAVTGQQSPTESLAQAQKEVEAAIADLWQ